VVEERTAGSEVYANARRAMRQLPYFTLGEPGRWLPAGPPPPGEPGMPAPLENGGALVAARWLGRVEDLTALTTMTFPARCLLSWTNPAAGQSRFALVLRATGGEGRIKDLRDWIKAESRPGEWLAVHSWGEGALAGLGDWRLIEVSHPRHAERLGAALVFSALAAGDPINWAALPDCQVKASSAEVEYPPTALLKGIFWPNPLAPNVWISRPLDDSGAVPWVELKLARSRPVDRLVLLWAGAAGWSGQFNPRRVRLLGTGEGGEAAELTPLKEIVDPDGPYTVWCLEKPLSLRRLRVLFPEPTQMPLDRQARLCAIQLWGPWGNTK
jgi:hypothetical protein